MALKPKLAPGSGSATSLGATITGEGVNFAVYSESASTIWVSLFDEQDREIDRFELDGREGPIHFGHVVGAGAGTKYGLRAEGRYDPDQGYWFDPAKLLVDPYAKRLDRAFVYDPRLGAARGAVEDTAPLMPKAVVVGNSAKPAQPRRKQPELIYELNVRGYSMRHPDVPQTLRGTVAALAQTEILDHLRSIGVDCVELMPVAAFIDERHLPPLGLRNAWGYNPVTYFAPDPRLMPRGIQELREVCDLYRKAGISVILDVVYNHTGESDNLGAVLSMRGLDALTYYRHVQVDGKQVLVNDTGTGNTLRCDHPAVQRLVIESLRYWMQEGGVSGFRFDLATVLGRTPGFDAQAPMLEMIRNDEVVGKALLVAEPWDIGPGGYHLGQFGKDFREWNDTYRDDVRSFWQGIDGRIGALASKVSGSSEIFDFTGRKPSHGVNFLAAHDGFTLRDAVSFVNKHNEANGEDNRDGHNHNSSWNCGVEGPTEDAGINAARDRDTRALLSTLLFSRGTPMLAQGDEFGRSQQGNNNAYAQDNDITWVDWGKADRALIDFVAATNGFRKAHPALTHDHFLSGQEKHGIRDVAWLHPDGREMSESDWNDRGASVLGMHLRVPEDEVLVWFNRRIDMVLAQLPPGDWAIGIVSDIHADVMVTGGKVTLPGRSVIALAPVKPVVVEEGAADA